MKRSRGDRVNRTFKARLAIAILIILISTQLVLGLGIRPAKTTIAFEQNPDYSGEFWIVNEEQREFSMDISIDGTMGKYITLSTNQISFREDEDAKPVQFEVNLPQEVPPGTSIGEIVVSETLQSLDAFTSKVVLKHKIIIEGPHPKKHVKVKLNFNKLENNIELISEVENHGEQGVEEIQTKFYVNDKKQITQELETEKTSLQKNENKLLKAQLPKEAVDHGEFEVTAITTYDDQKVEVIKNLIVGEPEIDITYFEKYFIANKINEYTLELLNKWNKKVENVYINVEILQENKKVDEFRTRPVNVDGFAREQIRDYFDTTGHSVGDYDFNLVVNFWNLRNMVQKNKTYSGKILEESEIKDSNLLGAAVVSKTSETKEESKTNISNSAAPIIFLIIIISYVAYRYKHRDEYE